MGVGFAAVAASVVQRRHALRIRMAERRARAAERMAEIGAMTGGLAHEIKNPLSTIGLNAQLLHEAVQELPCAEEDKSRLLARTVALRRETDRLGGILTDFLQYAGQVHLDRRRADLNAAVEELADFFLPEAERHGVRLVTQLAPAGLTAVVDVKLVKQALLNLMLNAVQAMHGAKATKEGAVRGGAGGSGELPPVGSVGELRLRTAGARDADGRRVAHVQVIDTGPGIPPETRDKIFSPYFTTRSGGSGLGLPTARRLIEEHGGRIDVDSTPGEGSVFTVVLPLEPPETA